MRCGWCGSENLSCEYVDIGVGRQQVTPYECISCGAVEVSPDHFTNPDEIDDEDRRRGWYAGPDSHAHAEFLTPPRIITPGQALYARDFWHGQRVLLVWNRLTHIAYKTRNNNNHVFETMCGIGGIGVANAPYNKHATCLACVVLEGAW
jgi:hypothetical protein